MFKKIFGSIESFLGAAAVAFGSGAVTAVAAKGADLISGGHINGTTLLVAALSGGILGVYHRFRPIPSGN